MSKGAEKAAERDFQEFLNTERGTMDAQTHWEKIYGSKAPDAVSWYRPHLERSLELIEQAARGRSASIIDVGGGESTLVDDLVARGYQNITVLDISQTAIDVTKKRLASGAENVHWLVGDITSAKLEPSAYDVWHDRAVFHFLTRAADRRVYVAQVRRALRPGGFALVATFATDGPSRCSGLEVARYSPDSLHAEFGTDFRLLSSDRQTHITPWGAEQPFTYCLCQYEPHASSRHAA
jgi:SAM-dependent methyltransferase